MSGYIFNYNLRLFKKNNIYQYKKNIWIAICTGVRK